MSLLEANHCKLRNLHRLQTDTVCAQILFMKIVFLLRAIDVQMLWLLPNFTAGLQPTEKSLYTFPPNAPVYFYNYCILISYTTLKKTGHEFICRKHTASFANVWVPYAWCTLTHDESPKLQNRYSNLTENLETMYISFHLLLRAAGRGTCPKHANSGSRSEAVWGGANPYHNFFPTYFPA